MKMMTHTLLGISMLSLAACGGGSSSPGANPVDVTLSGVVTAPSGTVAQMRPFSVTRMLANVLLGPQASALATGWTNLGSGVAVELIEVDAAGNQLGSALATATTASDGSYSLILPQGFTGGPQYVVRVGSGTVMDGRVAVSSGTLDIDPSTDAASDLVTDVLAASSASLSDLSLEELQTLIDETQDALADIDVTAYSDVTGVSTALLDSVQNDQERANVLYSSVAAGEICGTVTDSNGTALQNVLVVARDYGNWVTRSKAKTDASGQYCLNLPKTGDTDPFTGQAVTGEYILGAINRTAASYAASEWWTSGGGTNTQFGAEKITVGATSVTRDFSLLANGARVSGTVQGFDGIFAQGMKVLLRDYDTLEPAMSAKVKSDGTFRVNVVPGDYLISYRNSTQFHHYASEVYNNQHQRNLADRVSLAAGDNGPFDANLEAGAVLKGTVYTDSTATTPAVGTIVSIIHPNLSGTVERLRTNKQGHFRIWVQNSTDNPSGYYVTARGQRQTKIPDGTGIAFANDVAVITGKLVSDADGTTPVSRMFVRVSPWDGTNNKATGYISQDSTAEDGSFTVYAPAGNYIVYARADSDPVYGSGVFDGSDMNYIAYGDVGQYGTPVSITSTEVTNGLALNSGSGIRVPTLGITSSGTLNTGVGYIDGTAAAGATAVKINIPTAVSSTDKRLTTTASRGDGTFRVSVPAGTYKVKSQTAVCGSVTVNDGMTTTVTFSDASTCIAGSPH